jgi:hypothetical protein
VVEKPKPESKSSIGSKLEAAFNIKDQNEPVIPPLLKNVSSLGTDSSKLLGSLPGLHKNVSSLDSLNLNKPESKQMPELPK